MHMKKIMWYAHRLPDASNYKHFDVQSKKPGYSVCTEPQIPNKIGQTLV